METSKHAWIVLMNSAAVRETLANSTNNFRDFFWLEIMRNLIYYAPILTFSATLRWPVN